MQMVKVLEALGVLAGDEIEENLVILECAHVGGRFCETSKRRLIGDAEETIKKFSRSTEQNKHGA